MSHGSWRWRAWILARLVAAEVSFNTSRRLQSDGPVPEEFIAYPEPELETKILEGSTVACQGTTTYCDSEERRMPPGSLWRISNVDWVIDGWEVHELQLFPSGWCEEPRYGAQRTFSSALNTECEQWIKPFEGPCNAIKAFDGKEHTFWRAKCKRLTNGCLPYTTWVGVDVP